MMASLSTCGAEIEIYKLIEVDCDEYAEDGGGTSYADVILSSSCQAQDATTSETLHRDAANQGNLGTSVPREDNILEAVRSEPGTSFHADCPSDGKGQWRDSRPVSKILVNVCNMCNKVFMKQEQLAEHIVSEHRGACGTDRESTKCPYCGKYFPEAESLDQHIKACHDGARYCCEFCGKRFMYRAYLDMHLRTHDEALAAFQCDICGKTFNQKVHLSEHRLSHVSPKPYVCPVCAKTFTHRSNLLKHERTIHNNGDHDKYKCVLCNKAFSEQGNLYKHISAVHGNHKQWECKLCGASFKWHSALSCHQMNVHNMKVGYTCEECGKKFITRKRLEVHRRKHTGEMPFTCDACFVPFASDQAF